MNRTKLSENISCLNEIEVELFTWLTKKPIDWFNDLSNSDREVESILNTCFYFSFGIDSDYNNPLILKVNRKIIDGIYNKPLFENLEKWWDPINNPAARINKLYVGKMRKDVIIAIKAIAKRDFRYIVETFDYSKDLTLEEYMQKFEDTYIKDMQNWLCEEDYELILSFCGED
jgi:hypothetical protein